MALIKHGTLVADTVASVEVDGAPSTVEVLIVADPAPIYFRVDGTDPTVAGDDCEVVPAGIGAALVVDAGDPPIEVKLISAGTPTYSVRAA